MKNSDNLGKEPIGRLLVQQALPASIGILIMSIYGVVDTIFVGQYVGPLAIAAITVVMPITFLISSIGMAIGVGGSSMISRALGADDEPKACHTFGNMVLLTAGLALLMIALGTFLEESLLSLFGGKGEILEPAREYFTVLLPSIPFLAFAMMSNAVIRADGAPKVAMMVFIVPAVLNLILDPIFIVVLDWGLFGAALATTLGYISSALFAIWFFLSGRSDLTIRRESLRLEWPLIKEMFSIGSVTLARQGAISVLSIVLNNALFRYGAETAVTVYGMITRVLMVSNVPVMGLIQGFLPIVGYNYGARYPDRVKQTIRLSVGSGTAISLLLFVLVMVFPHPMLAIFTDQADLVDAAADALRIVYLATPLLSVQLLGSAYYQAIG
ncbi:MAG: MATE family efflux transporter, partial [Bacteroidota bacterium]